MEHTTTAIHLAKSVFQVAVSSHHGSVEAERWLSRDLWSAIISRDRISGVLS